MKKNNTENKKNSKRSKLIIANIVVIFIVFIVALVQLFIFGSIDLVTYLSTILGFALLSLVVYYISIIADALNERTRRYKENMTEAEKKSDDNVSAENK